MFTDFPFLEETALCGDWVPRGLSPPSLALSPSQLTFLCPLFPISSLSPIVLLVITYLVFGGSVLTFWGTQAGAMPT